MVPPYSFEIYGSRSGAGDWELLGTVGDTNWFIDTARHLYALSPRYSYFVRLTDADDHVYDSEVRQANGNLTARQAPEVSKILKNERLWYRKGGCCGLLYKRRQWGIPCPVCVEPDTHDVVGGATCTTCFGTGIVGGYFDPIIGYWGPSVRAQPSSRYMQQDENTGTVDPQVIFRRAVACPYLDSRDVWVQADTDIHYNVARVQPVDYRGVPIIYDPVELRVIPTTDIVYRLPRPDALQAPSGSSSG